MNQKDNYRLYFGCKICLFSHKQYPGKAPLNLHSNEIMFITSIWLDDKAIFPKLVEGSAQTLMIITFFKFNKNFIQLDQNGVNSIVLEDLPALIVDLIVEN